MQVMHNFPNKMQAVRGVLVESCQVLDRASVQYVVAGGWVPYLRGADNSFFHPGTNDVDLLFNDDPAPIKSALELLLQTGYVPSAKHPFQLLKPLTVDGQDFVFNVDLMHPAETDRDQDMFHDIIDLGVKDDYDSHITHVIKSISLPSARIIFDHTLWSRFPIEAILPDGHKAKIDIPLMDETGSVLSKCVSISVKKRPRDAFDVFFVLGGPHGDAIAKQLRELSQRFPQVKTQLEELKSFLTHHSEIFDARVQAYTPNRVVTDSAAKVLTLLFQN
jgi:hypothetical protein